VWYADRVGCFPQLSDADVVQTYDLQKRTNKEKIITLPNDIVSKVGKRCKTSSHEIDLTQW